MPQKEHRDGVVVGVMVPVLPLTAAGPGAPDPGPSAQQSRAQRRCSPASAAARAWHVCSTLARLLMCTAAPLAPGEHHPDSVRFARPSTVAPLPPGFFAAPGTAPDFQGTVMAPVYVPPPPVYVIASFPHSAKNGTELSIAPGDKLEVGGTVARQRANRHRW